MPSQGQLTDDERFGIELLTGLMSDGWYDIETSTKWPCALKEPLSRNLAEERAYDIIIGAYYSQSDKIKAAKRRHYDKKLGFEKCLQLAFNFHNDYTVDDVKAFIDKFLDTTWKQLANACFVVEFFSYDNYDDIKWNPHIHVWLPYSPPAALRQLAIRKFGSDKCNVHVSAGHKNLKNYITGTKTGSGKSELQLKDKKFRSEHNIQHVYYFNVNSE